MPKKFVNVHCAGVTTRINVTDMEDLSELRRAVKGEYGDAIDTPALIQLWAGETRITDLGDIPEKYYEKIKNGGLSLAIQTTSSPSRNASSSSPFADPDSTEPALKKQRTEDLPRPIDAFLDHGAWLEFVSSERLKLP
ncbi:hypothetical protein HK100_008500, partial [Physocladia obscura]